MDAKNGDTQINWKGVRDYIRAARILSDHAEPPIGPVLLCRGQAVEIALKVFLEHRSIPNPGHHKLIDLYAQCAKAPNPLALTADQERVIEGLHPHHFRDGDLSHPSRYRSNLTRVVLAPGQEAVEALVKTILTQAHPDLGLKKIT